MTLLVRGGLSADLSAGHVPLASVGMPPDSEAVRETLLAMPRAERNVCFLAFRGAEPAGVAIASAEGGVAQLRFGGPRLGRQRWAGQTCLSARGALGRMT